MSAEACSHSVECLSALAPTSPKSILSFLLCIPHPVCCLNPKALDLASRTTLKPTVVTDASNKRQAGAGVLKPSGQRGVLRQTGSENTGKTVWGSVGTLALGNIE